MMFFCIYQAHQGQDMDSGIATNSMADDGSAARIPVEADFLIALSTVSGRMLNHSQFFFFCFISRLNHLAREKNKNGNK